MQHVYAQTHSDKYTRSNGSCRCCKWQRQERPITTATDLTTILPASVKCSLSHSLSPPPPLKNLKHIYAHPHTQTLRDAGRIMKIQPYAADLSSSFFSSWQTHPHMHAHTCTHRGNPSPAFRPSLQPWHAVEGGRRPHLENRRGLLLCFDGELTPGVACSFSAKARMKEEQKVSHTLQYTLAKIPLLCFFSFPYHGELLRGGGLCCKQCWGVWCYIGWRNIFG